LEEVARRSCFNRAALVDVRPARQTVDFQAASNLTSAKISKIIKSSFNNNNNNKNNKN
jgi:hypothetical protein